ncbi:MAG: hypothetical protein HPY53_06220 [Brevinematales bacterium]|nr:hypothetical protein [Brevinematales bacterium]
MWGTNIYFINYNQIVPEMSCLEVIFGIVTTLATGLMAAFTVILARVNSKLAKIEQERHEEEKSGRIVLEDIDVIDITSMIYKVDEKNQRIFIYAKINYSIINMVLSQIKWVSKLN